jgi:exo-1,4-beta-D-glucosaminidase
MFEAYGRNKYQATGVIQWMLNNAWPGLIWHLYDYSLRPAGGYFGTKKALEPLHVQFSYDDRGIAVVNSTREVVKGLRVVAKSYDLNLKELFSREGTTDVAADGVAKMFAIPEPPAESTTYFLSLQLYRSTGELAGRNFYWLSTKPDTLDFSKTEWYYTPLSSFADFKPLQDLPKATVKASIKVHESGVEAGGHVTVENTGVGIAFLIRLRLLKQAQATEILPVFWEDNYFSLLPGEKREVSVNLRRTDLGGTKVVLAVDGYNVTPVTVHAGLN